jgi:hypothetical protein
MWPHFLTPAWQEVKAGWNLDRGGVLNFFRVILKNLIVIIRFGDNSHSAEAKITSMMLLSP